MLSEKGRHTVSTARGSPEKKSPEQKNLETGSLWVPGAGEGTGESLMKMETGFWNERALIILQLCKNAKDTEVHTIKR
jgi:hypothetical protein